MDRAQAINAFWNSFGLRAYDENTVPQNAVLPYITYEVATADFEDGDVPLTANIWYQGKSWADITQKAEEIAEEIGYGGKTIKTDKGYIWIKRRTPFAQRMSDNNDNIRRILIGISAEYL
jgi:hypothetical protein